MVIARDKSLGNCSNADSTIVVMSVFTVVVPPTHIARMAGTK